MARRKRRGCEDTLCEFLETYRQWHRGQLNGRSVSLDEAASQVQRYRRASELFTKYERELDKEAGIK